jgi:hypothetical protein
MIRDHAHEVIALKEILVGDVLGQFQEQKELLSYLDMYDKNEEDWKRLKRVWKGLVTPTAWV